MLRTALLAGCGRTSDGGSSAAPAGAQARDWFVDAAPAAGLDFTHFNGMSGKFYYPEIMAPGVALLDYDNDGDLDIYVTQGQMLGAPQAAGAGGDSAASVAERRDRLFRNDTVTNADGTRSVHFTDARRRA